MSSHQKVTSSISTSTCQSEHSPLQFGMTAIMSPGSSPATSPLIPTPSANPNQPALSPLVTSPLVTSPPGRRTTLPRPMSHASKNRLSQYSTGSGPGRSRPQSHISPLFPSSLPYALVRDFAYPAVHPMHYGPPPEPSPLPSGMTTPASESRRLSEFQPSWEMNKLVWVNPQALGNPGAATEDSEGLELLAPTQFGDGPPWSEDEDLQSPVVSPRYRKHKSAAGYGHGRNRSARDGPTSAPSNQGGGSGVLSPGHFDRERGYYMGTTGDGSERYYVNQGDEANGPGGEYVTYSPDQARHSIFGQPSSAYLSADQQPRQYLDLAEYSDTDSNLPSSPSFRDPDQSRYSRDYQFTITSPDEEMHGKAVALFNFERENDNELPLVEGQIIWVSYRHGQGWLVAMDPKTQESGLVPEEYVRLLRHIEGGMTSLACESPVHPKETGKPTPTEPQEQQQTSPDQAQFPQGGQPSQQRSQHAVHQSSHVCTMSTGSNSNGYHQPIVSTFSTSSKDLDLYPQHLLGTQAGQAPPQVVHYHGQRGGSQTNTPTMILHQDSGGTRRRSQDASASPSRKAETENATGGPEALSDTNLKGKEGEPDGREKIEGCGKKEEEPENVARGTGKTKPAVAVR